METQKILGEKIAKMFLRLSKWQSWCVDERKFANVQWKQILQIIIDMKCLKQSNWHMNKLFSPTI